MKNPRAVLAGVVLTFGFGLVLQGQTAAGGGQTAATQNLPSPTPYAITTQDANSRVWERTTYEKAADGSVVARKSDYTEIQSGLNFKDPATGQWKESREEIDIQTGSDGASAISGQHQAYFPGDIFQGTIKEVTPDGLQLQSRPVGLFFADDTNSVLIAILTNSVGELVSSNQVVYRNAFEGADASIRYTYRKAGFEQDVIVQGQLPDPAALGLDPARTRLGMLTVFFDTNNPVATPGATDAADGLKDWTLTFGKMTIGRGRAFAIGNTEPSTPPVGATPAQWLNWFTNSVQQSKETPTFKHWFQMDGRNYLMEEVPYQRVAAQLKQLPAATARQNVISTKLYAANTFLDAIPARLLSPATQVSKTKMTRLARRDQLHGLVLDYMTVNSGGNYTFQGNTTYYVSGPCYLGSVTLDGGTVIKYENMNYLYPIQIGNEDTATAFIMVDGTLTCNTTGTSPAIFTAADDNTVGQTIEYSTGSPAGPVYANPAIYAPGNAGVNLSNVRINYARQGVWAGDGGSITLSDSQVNNSQVMAVLGLGDGIYAPMTLTCNNCLYNGPYYGILVFDCGDGGDHYNLTNCTFNNLSYLVCGSTTYIPDQGNAVNSIFASSGMYVQGNSTWQGGYNGFYSAGTTFGSPKTTATSNPFQTSGSFYLASGCPFRNIGTTAISSTLLADLQNGTTYTLSAGGWPDTDTPDLGYHYPLQDSDNDGLPDWWEMYWFGNLTHSGSDLDAGGNTLLTDYQNYLNGTPTDPNVIQFSIAATNDYVNHTNVSLQLNVTAGVPSYYAVFMGGSGATNWLAFTTTNLTVNVGATDGVYDVNVGLKGFATNATQTWNDYSVTVDRAAPVVVINNPASNNAVVIKPYLQLQGFANEPLMSLSYDISNATGIATNQNAFVTDQAFDTNKFDSTTNWFQAYDVPLTNGVNHVTLRVSDRAGNVTTTNFNVTLNYSGATNPPVVSLIWPQDGWSVSGTSCTIRGTMSDETGTVVAQVINGDGTTNIINGIVERNGMFWLENVPLNGTNAVGVQATDAAGNVTTTNFIVKPGSLTLTIDSTPAGDDLYRPSGSVGGTVSDPTAAVSVNGVSATVDSTANGSGTYNWNADGVPIYGRGTATFDAQATGGGGATAKANASPEMQPYVMVVDYSEAKTYKYSDMVGDQDSSITHKNYSGGAQPGADGQWHETYVGGADINDSGIHEGWPYSSDDQLSWSDTDPSGLEIYTIGGVLNYAGPIIWNDDATALYYFAAVSIPDQDQVWGCASCGPGYESAWMTHYYAKGVHYSWPTPYDQGDITLGAVTHVRLYTGGKMGVGRQNLFCINAGADEYFQAPEYGWWLTQSQSVDKVTLTVLGKHPGSDGNLWVVLPDNSEQDITVHAPKQHYNAWATATKYKLKIQVNSAAFLSPVGVVAGANYCVGQGLFFDAYWLPNTPPFADGVSHWTLPGTFVNEQPYSYCPAFYDEDASLLNSIYSVDNTLGTFCWYVDKVQAGTASVAMSLSFPNGQTAFVNASGQFNVYRPTYTSPVTTWSSAQIAVYPGSSADDAPLREYGHTIMGLQPPTGNSMTFNVVVNSQFQGTAEFTQLMNGYATNTVSPISTSGTDELDTSDPYPYEGPAHTAGGGPNYYATPAFEDSPWNACSVSPSVAQFTFTDYLRFRPDGDDQNIFVTLGIITWGYYGKANEASGAWSLDSSSSVTGPTGPADSISFPYWTQVFSVW